MLFIELIFFWHINNYITFISWWNSRYAMYVTLTQNKKKKPQNPKNVYTCNLIFKVYHYFCFVLSSMKNEIKHNVGSELYVTLTLILPWFWSVIVTYLDENDALVEILSLFSLKLSLKISFWSIHTYLNAGFLSVGHHKSKSLLIKYIPRIVSSCCRKRVR